MRNETSIKNGKQAPAGCLGQMHVVTVCFDTLSHVARAEKFGAEYVEPSQRKELLLEAKKERWNREGFTTGFDVFSKVS
jgi:hypothetical protein